MIPTKIGVIGLLGIFGLTGAAFAGAGNGLPSGAHYNLELIAKKQCPSDAMKSSNRHVIFLLASFSDPNVVGSTKLTLNMTNKIKLAQGDFNVLDGNACDGDGATFQLPANPFTCASTNPPCADPSFQNYKVYIRPVGKPGTSLKMTTCGFEAGADGILGSADDTAICSTESTLQVRATGGKKFADVTKQLTTLYVDIDGDEVMDRIGLFDPRLQDYFWSVDTNGQAHVQVMFSTIR